LLILNSGGNGRINLSEETDFENDPNKSGFGDVSFESSNK